MSARRSTPETLPPTEEDRFLDPGPISTSDIRMLHTLVDLQRAVGGIERAVGSLETTTKSHREKLDQLGKMQYALSILERANVFHGQRLGQLEKEIYAAKIIAGLVVAAGVLAVLVTYLIHGLSAFFSK